MTEPDRITSDIPCSQCGYTLQGLPATGYCPGCGSRVSESVRSDLLQFADPDWLARVKLGTDLLNWSLVLKLLLALAGTCTVGAVSIVSPAALTRLGTHLLQLISPAVDVVTVFLLTAEEPRSAPGQAGWTWPKVIRSAAIAAFVAQTAQLGFSSLAATVAVIRAVADPIIVFGEFAYARSFALRIPDARLARSTEIVQWGLSLTTLVSGLSDIAAMIWPPATLNTATLARPSTPAPSRPGHARRLPFTTIALPSFGTLAPTLAGGCLVTVSSIVFCTWAFVLLSRYRRALRRAITSARAKTTD